MTHLKEEAGVMMFEFADDTDRTGTERLADIKVVGVGGAGGNAVGRMIEAGLVGVEFFAMNTDLQALHDSPAHRTLQIGAVRTKGLGSGGDPAVGRAAAEEDLDGLREALSGADMVFVTAGMGGGTGTGAAPVIARVARELGALTVAIVTKPFRFEASVRMQQALAGIEELRQSVDTLIIIPNQRLLEVVPRGTTMREAFRIADNVLYEATRGIYEIISRHDHVNLDFADVRTVMKDMGQAMMGTGRAEGPDRAVEAARQAISSPLLEDVDIRGSRAVLVNVLGRDVGLQDTAEAMEFIQEAAGPQAHVIFGYGNDESLGDTLQLTVIATGFDAAHVEDRAAPAAVAAAAAVAPGQAPTPEILAATETPAANVVTDAEAEPDDWNAPWPAATLAGDEAVAEAAAAELAAREAAEREALEREEQELAELEAQLRALEEEEARQAAEAEAAAEAARVRAEEEVRLAAEAEIAAEAARLQAEEEARLRAEREAHERAEYEARVRQELEDKLREEIEARVRQEHEAQLREAQRLRELEELEARELAEQEAVLTAEAEAAALAAAEAEAAAAAAALAAAEAATLPEPEFETSSPRNGHEMPAAQVGSWSLRKAVSEVQPMAGRIVTGFLSRDAVAGGEPRTPARLDPLAAPQRTAAAAAGGVGRFLTPVGTRNLGEVEVPDGTAVVPPMTRSAAAGLGPENPNADLSAPAYTRKYMD
ncbi:MAG: cell division protein FtsZ [bacterium]|nr:cell division protein FtsZ [bacterium]